MKGYAFHLVCGLPGCWKGGLEATMFTSWIYDHLRPHAVELQVAHPARLKAIIAGKKKNDRIDARTLADLLRCNLFPAVYMLPPELRELRQMVRFRNLLVGQTTQMKNRIAALLMESGLSYNKRKLHGKKYFRQLLPTLEPVAPSVLQLLHLSRNSVEFLQQLERRVRSGLLGHESLRRRVDLLQSIPGVGVILSWTWALKVGEVERFRSVAQAVSYSGLCSAQNSSAGKETRGPISRQRNKHLQRVLVEAAKLAPRWNPELAAVYERERQRGNRNRATLAVARKLVAYLLAVDRRQKPFQVGSRSSGSEAPEGGESVSNPPGLAMGDCVNGAFIGSRDTTGLFSRRVPQTQTSVTLHLAGELRLQMDVCSGFSSLNLEKPVEFAFAPN